MPRTEWADASGAGYSPGKTLVPIDEPRAPAWLGPVVALFALFLVVGALVFVATRAMQDRGDDGEVATLITSPTSGLAPSATAANGAVSGPTPTLGADTGPAPTATMSPTSESDGAEPTSARAFLPALSDLPPGFVRTEDDRRTKEQVSSSFPDPDETAALLDEWGWDQNAYRTFEIPADTAPDPNQTIYVNVSVHRFAGPRKAGEALPYFANALVEAGGFVEIEGEQYGDESILLTRSQDGNSVVIYLRTDQFVIRIWATSPSGDPTADVMALAETILAE